MTLMYGPQEFAGQLNSNAVEGGEYGPYVRRVRVSAKRTLLIEMNGARDLAIDARHAVPSMEERGRRRKGPHCRRAEKG